MSKNHLYLAIGIISGREHNLSVCKKQNLKRSHMLDVFLFGGITKLVGFTIKGAMEVEAYCLCGIKKFLIMKIT